MTNQPSEGQWHNGQLGASVCKGEPSKVPNLAELIDVPALQSLLDDFYRLARIPVTIVDLDGTLLVAAGWQEICGKFHRAHAESRQLCLQSDTELTGGIPSGECRLYKCKNNLWDMATPITVDGHHVGNVVSGQFFFEGERVDERVFEAQAKRFGFNRSEYLAAFAAVPRLSREVVNTGISFLVKLAETISRVGYSNFRLKHSLAERDSLTRSLQQNELLLNQQAVDLEKLVQERTAKLQETVEELEHYSYTLTHDLRAPLRAGARLRLMLLDESQLLSGERLSRLTDRPIGRTHGSIDPRRTGLQPLRSDHPLTLVDLDELVRDLVNSHPTSASLRPRFRFRALYPASRATLPR
ncbi:MAG: PocR ligand-binding domain-containing protein [Verrucomicrobiota bacterium]